MPPVDPQHETDAGRCGDGGGCGCDAPAAGGPSAQGRRLTGRAYWRSLDELADSPKFREALSKEFADYSPDEIIDSPTRRGFMKLMGASMALAGAGGLSGCRRWPERVVVPYAQRPEGRVPGVPEHYASVMELGGVGRPVVVTSFDGRPIKVEGNALHGQSAGAADVFCQASVLELYDPDRSRRVLREGRPSTWDAFAAGIGAMNLHENGGEGFAVLSEAVGSPSMIDMRRRLLEAMPEARWYEYEPINRDNEIEGARLAFGAALRPHLHLERARVIVTLEADILGAMHPAGGQYARGWVEGRRGADEGRMNRMWAIDSGFSVTSSNADRRLPTRSSRVADVLDALARELGVGEGPAGGAAPELDENAARFVRELADDLRGAEGASVLVAGPNQPPEVHAAVWMLNDRLGNLGRTVSFTRDPIGDAPPHTRQIAALAQDMHAGRVHTLLILGGNPVYNAPVDLEFGAALRNVENTIHLSLHDDETSGACTVHLPRSHYLESWGDAALWDGTVCVQQPLIQPLYGTRSTIEVLAMVIGDQVRDGYQIVRRTFGEYLPADRFEREWRRVLHDGLLDGSAAETVPVHAHGDHAGRAGEANRRRGAGGGGVELVFQPSYGLYDGRFANHGWLQELPDPITKVTWDNAALIGPATARRLGVGQDSVIRISIGQGEDERFMDAAVYIMPGQAPDSIGIAMGYGRSRAGYIGDGVGFDAYQLRETGAMGFIPAVRVSPRARTYKLATTQLHHAIDVLGQREREDRTFRDVLRGATLEEYQQYLANDPAGEFEPVPVLYTPKDKAGMPLQLFDPPVEFKGHKWGMGIDLNACIGCNACMVACQAENNVAIVGKREVRRGRDMHWIRVDRYFAGDPENPRAAHQPLTCHHCDNAPCEQVCPVAATVHDTEGLNVMIYNRCVGTRYCSNNCPYKVRRFNYFDWHVKPVKSGPTGSTYLGFPDEQQQKVDPLRRMQFNPEVTVRMRGVMEKCTFCTQRIEAVTIRAKNQFSRGERETWRVRDGEITPACAQSCPTDAIVFGDLNDPDSRVARRFASPRAYEVLKDLNVRARTRYLGRIANPGPGRELPGTEGEPVPVTPDPGFGSARQREEHG